MIQYAFTGGHVHLQILEAWQEVSPQMFFCFFMRPSSATQSGYGKRFMHFFNARTADVQFVRL